MKAYRSELSYEQVCACLDYDPLTGVLTHKRAANNRPLGSVAGRKDNNGYLRVRLLGQELKAHRLAWLLHHGAWPTAEVDHINGQVSDNRIVNLRVVGVYENSQNRRAAQRNNKTGLLGVAKTAKGFFAQIKAKHLRIRKGPYKTPEEAYNVYLELKRIVHPLGTL